MPSGNRHIPTPESDGKSGFTLCGRFARWHYTAREIRSRMAKHAEVLAQACPDCRTKFENETRRKAATEEADA